MIGGNFKLVLKLHTPFVLTKVLPTLDVLLTEAVRRYHQDWKIQPDLPLVFNEQAGVYEGSQIIFGHRPHQPISAIDFVHAQNPDGLERHVLSKAKRVIKEDGGGTARRVSKHQSITAGYAIFYGRGDLDGVLKFLPLIYSAGGKCNSHGGAYFTFDSAEYCDSDRGLLRNVKRSYDAAKLVYQAPSESMRKLLPWDTSETLCWAPGRILKEIVR